MNVLAFLLGGLTALSISMGILFSTRYEARDAVRDAFRNVQQKFKNLPSQHCVESKITDHMPSQISNYCPNEIKRSIGKEGFLKEYTGDSTNIWDDSYRDQNGKSRYLEMTCKCIEKTERNDM